MRLPCLLTRSCIMKLTNNILSQFKKQLSVLALSYSAILGLLILTIIIGKKYNIPIAHFTRDPTAILGGLPITGFISSIGMLFWCSTSAICFFSSVLSRKSGDAIISRFLFFSGLLTCILLLDDLFLFHEAIAPKYFHLNEKIIFLGYILFTLGYLFKFKKIIINTEYIFLALSFFFFALSVLYDIFFSEDDLGYLIEDGFKLFGIVTWSFFLISTCFSKTNDLNLSTKNTSDKPVT